MARARSSAPLLIETHHIDALLRLPLPGRRRERGGLRPARRPGARGRRSSSSARTPSWPSSPRPVVGATVGRGARRCRLFQAHPRDLRPLRRAADPRRGDVRHGPHRHAARLRAGRRRARPHDDRQGPRRRLPADRRGAALAAASSTPSPKAPASSSTATPIWATRMACAAALAVQEVIERDRLLDNVRRMGAHLAAPPRRALRQPPPCRRHPRARPVPWRSSWSPTASARRRSIRR